jgi:hypothetical protein
VPRDTPRALLRPPVRVRPGRVGRCPLIRAMAAFLAIPGTARRKLKLGGSYGSGSLSHLVRPVVTYAYNRLGGLHERLDTQGRDAASSYGNSQY